MLGCRTESVFGITATSTLAGLADYFDLDGHLDIKNDFCQGLTFNKGTLELPKNILGIGVKINEIEWK